MITTQLMLIAY